jgi:hypothetical protein
MLTRVNHAAVVGVDIKNMRFVFGWTIRPIQKTLSPHYPQDVNTGVYEDRASLAKIGAYNVRT